jgi:hypothetical protein
MMVSVTPLGSATILKDGVTLPLTRDEAIEVAAALFPLLQEHAYVESAIEAHLLEMTYDRRAA